MVDIVSSVPHQVSKTELTPLDNTFKRSKVLHAIAALEKNKIPASNDSIIRQINDPTLTRKEVLEIISQLYIDGAIKKSKGNFKVTKPRKKRLIEPVLESSTIAEPLPTLVPPVVPVPPIIPLPSATTAGTPIPSVVPSPGPPPSGPVVVPPATSLPAGVTIPHDGLPTISSVHSYQAGKTMSFPVGKVDEPEKVRYVHPWQILPRYIQPSGKVVYQPGMPSRFVHPAQMIPLHIPHGAAMPEHPPPGIPTFPPAYYPFVPGQPDGKPVQWVFYPVSIPVNAVRPFVQEKSPKTNEEEPTDPTLAKIKSPEHITNEMIDNVPTMEGEAIKVKAVADIHPRNSLKLAQPCTDKAKFIAEDFNKASSLLRDQGPNRNNSTMTSPKENGSPTSFSTNDGRDNLTDEINRLSAKHPREALLAKKRKQLSGIVDRVTEVAASKQNIEDQKKSINNGTHVTQPLSLTTPEINMNNEPEPIKYIYTPINEQTVGKHSLQAFHPRFSLLPKAKETDEEKGQRLKEFSSLDNVRNILKAPPDFITNPAHPAPPPTVSTKTNISTEPPVFIHPRKILYNNDTPPIVRKTPEPNAFEQKIITEVNNSIKSLHSMTTKNRNSPIAQLNNTNDSNDIFRELERKAILEAKEFSKRINENTDSYQTNNPNVQSNVSSPPMSREDHPPNSSCDTLDSESEEYHALKEISILQSANNPIIQTVTGTSTTYASSILNVTPTIGTPHIRHFNNGDNSEHIHDSHITESDCEIISDDEVYTDEDEYDDGDNEDDNEDDNDDDEDYELLYGIINSSKYLNEDLKNLYIFNPSLILENVLQVEQYKHLIPPIESDSDGDIDDDDDGDDGDNENDGDNSNAIVPVQEEKLKNYPIRHKQIGKKLEKKLEKKLDKMEVEIEDEDEPSKRRKNGEKYKDLPLRTDREKRRRVDVFYKVTRTNFMTPPQPKKTRRNLRPK